MCYLLKKINVQARKKKKINATIHLIFLEVFSIWINPIFTLEDFEQLSELSLRQAQNE